MLFHGGDICRVLGYADSADAIKRHCKYAKKLRTGVSPVLDLNPRGELFIPESDVYRLTFGSKMPFAEEFRDWICEVVIPTLRRTGRYEIGPPADQVPEMPKAESIQAKF